MNPDEAKAACEAPEEVWYIHMNDSLWSNMLEAQNAYQDSRDSACLYINCYAKRLV